MRLRLSLIAAVAGAAALAACGQNNQAAESGSGEVNLYTARHYDADLALYERFTEETGIRVNRIEGNADQLIARMQSEGANSPADVFVSADAGALWRAQNAGLFQAAESETLNEAIPENLRASGGEWFGFSRRARVVAYNSETVSPDEIDTYEELASPRFRGRLCVRSGDNVYNLSLVGALIEAWGVDKTRDWVEGIVANMARQPEGGDRDQIRAVAAGVCDIALTNSYYYIRMASGDDEGDRALTETVKLGFPSLDGQGSHVNISGGGVAANAPNRENAVRLLEFLASAESQTLVSQYNNEFPASPNVPAPAPVDAYADFDAHPMPVSSYGPNQAQAQSLMSEAGWR
ncbi:extracellular solute-binding protein [Brevundimonas sp. BAL450]|jgi:iron(III) transport system substrate-binding protein|uniref:Ferric iron ABC transporter, iron-binding protein n=1 Tax=Brevundimonas abyssalis TAR-001 TaxID=1391729 RepID=A0A8E0NAB9_9CAUL|nr:MULTISPECIES: extracellular solute-binding protein [Brevundimonas]MBG7615458.1 extracellular solute-binding protein [Brevundimonas sp. BAL450]GAD57853.1 ferric iron ABC transporter, iron-binding protein [Brevundimonas abyssalis TAR-001]